MVSVRDGVFLFAIGCGFVLLMESTDKVAFIHAVPLIILALISFHLALFSVVAPHRLGIKKDDTYTRQPRSRRIGVPLVIATAGIGVGFGVSALLS